jgi:large subunit ribosomal protein L7/L12
MVTESEILLLRSRITQLEERVDFLYKHLGITYTENSSTENARVIDMLKRGNKIEAIKIYREIYNVGLAEAKDAVESLESRLGL